MPALPLAIIETQYAPNAATTLYTSPAGVATRIDALSVTNPTGGSATITIYLVPSGSSAGTGFTTTSAQAVLPGQTFNSPNEAGHVLNAGGFISVIASAATTLVINAAGTRIS